MRYRLRTLLIVLALGPPVLAVGYSAGSRRTISTSSSNGYWLSLLFLPEWRWRFALPFSGRGAGAAGPRSKLIAHAPLQTPHPPDPAGDPAAAVGRGVGELLGVEGGAAAATSCARTRGGATAAKRGRPGNGAGTAEGQNGARSSGWPTIAGGHINFYGRTRSESSARRSEASGTSSESSWGKAPVTMSPLTLAGLFRAGVRIRGAVTRR